MKTRPLILLASYLAMLAIPAQAEVLSPAFALEKQKQHDDRMAWWREARFGVIGRIKTGHLWALQNRPV